ncbi:serine protease [Rhizobiaceae bacterium]|nr:serine protease [Rhizobiaceae bacterium]
MKNDEKTTKAYAESVLSEDLRERVLMGEEVVPEMVESTEGEARPKSTAAEGRRATKGLRKVLRNEPLSDDELFAVEAIVLPFGRPVIDIVDGTYGALPDPWGHYAQPKVRDVLTPLMRSIGRIELPNHPQLPYGGTGFVVGDGLLMTNRHVAEIFATGVGAEGLNFRTGLEAGVDFLQERGRSASDFIEVKRVAMIHPWWDMALLEVEGLGDRPALELTGEDPQDAPDREIAVIGYPAFDPRNAAEVQQRIFGGVYNVKRLHPGRLKTRESVWSYGKDVDSVTHDSSTLGGNSGSAVIDVSSGKVIGLHFAGLYHRANYAVPSAELSRDGRVIDAGVAFDRTDAGPTAWDRSWQEADAPEAERGAVASAPGSHSVAAANAPVSGLSSRRITIPIQIDISIGTADGGADDMAVGGNALSAPAVVTEGIDAGSVTLIHGIGNKPEAAVLQRVWLDALARDGGPDLRAAGTRVALVHWADVLYAAPERPGQEGLGAEEAFAPPELPEPADAEHAQWLAATGAKVGAGVTLGSEGARAENFGAEAFPLPPFIEGWFVRTFLRDVGHYLFNVEHTPRPGTVFRVQDEIRRRFVATLKRQTQGSGPHIVLSHSMGTVIAYDCLKRVRSCPAVDGFMTVGSPLGMSEVQDRLKPEHTYRDGFPAKVRGGWANIYDRFDPVAFADPRLFNDYERGGHRVVADHRVRNDGPLNHSITHYLHTQKLRAALGELTRPAMV